MNTSKKLFALIVFAISIATQLNAETGKYRLMFNGNPSTEITIGFDAYVTYRNPIVYYSTSEANVNSLSNCLTKTPYKLNSMHGMVNCFAKLENLLPGKTYYFVVKDNNSTSEVYNFETISDSNEANLSILAGSDSRNNWDVRRVANKIIAKLNAHALLFGGDMTNKGRNSEWESWFNDWQLAISETNRITPIVVCRGNHEKDNTMLVNLFDSNQNVYYANSFGGNLLRVYTLNSEVPLFGDQSEWLEENFENNANVVWKIVQYHTPMRPHTIEKADGASQYARWADLFYQNSVDIVMEGDAHTVKSTWPIIPCTGGFDCKQGFKRDDIAGTNYLGEGTFASPLRANNDIKSWTRDSGQFHQFKLMHINKSKIDIRTIVYDDQTDTDAIETLGNSNRFTIPQNLEIWNPSNGAVITLNGPGSMSPVCSINQPMDNSMYENFETITIDVEATGSSNISQVDVYVNGSSFASKANAPYSFNFKPTVEGIYFISAIAEDSNGLSSPMATHVVKVGSRSNVVHKSKININSDEYYETLATGYIQKNSYKEKICNYNKTLQGLRFGSINIPENATIQSASILFETQSGSDSATAQIWAEKNEFSLPFVNTKYNISEREKTNSYVEWINIPNWFNSPPEADRTSPNLSSIVQELVDLPNWTIESPITFLIKGTGRRDAISFYAGDRAYDPYRIGTPILTVEYTLPNCPNCITISTNNTAGNSYYARDCIIAKNAIPAGIQSVDYSANGFVVLESGFSVPVGTSFNIGNSGCQ